MGRLGAHWWPWIGAILGFATVVAIVLVAVLRADDHPFVLGDANAVEFALTSSAAALASTLGILIALVLLTVQLTAQRYSFHVINLFIRRPINPILVGLFVVTITLSLWITAITSPEYVPDEAAAVALALGVVCFALLLPYFFTLFALLSPTGILSALEQDALNAVRGVVRGAPPARRRAVAAAKVQNLGDIALSAVQLTDIEVAKHSVNAIQRVVTLYLDIKGEVPGGWFQIEETHFLGHNALTLTELAESRTWLEMRAFLELQRIFNATLGGLSDVNSATALALREVAEHALLAHDDVPVTRLAMKFFNTLLRAAITRGDVRAAYHLLYQYRLLAERMVEARPDLAAEIAHRLAYYGQVGADAGLEWVSVTAVYDLRKLAEHADADFALDHLLELVAALARRRFAALRDVYKSVVALGSFALAHGRPAVATRLAAALATCPEADLDAVAAELVGVTDPFFWELTDRVINFDYLEPAVRARVHAFRDLAAARVTGGARRAEDAELLDIAAGATHRPGGSFDDD